MMATAAQRAERLQRIIDGYEADGPDGSVPHAARPEKESHPRYVLVEQHGDHGNYYVNLAHDLPKLEALAAYGVQENSMPVCYFDLDELAGEEPHIYEGDIVAYAAGDVRYDYRVLRVDEELIEGEVGHYLCLVEVGKEDPENWDDYDHRVHEDDVGIVERVEPDERMPVRYLVAKVHTLVAFNTTAETKP